MTRQRDFYFLCLFVEPDIKGRTQGEKVMKVEKNGIKDVTRAKPSSNQIHSQKNFQGDSGKGMKILL